MDEEIKKPKRRKKEVEKIDDGATWNYKRIAIFITILAVIFLSVVLLIRSRGGRVLGESAGNNIENKPQIELPEGRDVEKILREAQDSISDIDPKDIVSSQPQIQNAIEELKKLTEKGDIKESICAAICSQDESRDREK